MAWLPYVAAHDIETTGDEAILYEESVEPCIPRHWPGFEATVRVGLRACRVLVDNASGAGRGVASSTLDGVAVTSPIVALEGPERTELRIVLGEATRAAE